MTTEVNSSVSSRRLPPWLTKHLPSSGEQERVRELLADLDLATVCSGAHCPNQAECFAKGTATFMILGNICTRSCKFCAIPTGQPAGLREDEPQIIAEAALRMGLKHVVVTSVTRDDLEDGGADHFARTIEALRQRLGKIVIEVLTPDFQSDHSAIRTVLQAGPDIFNHNLETVARLQPTVRPQASYARSLEVLEYAKQCSCNQSRRLYTKSGLMGGRGGTLEAMRDLRKVGCDMLTIGQYLCPSGDHLPVDRFVEPKEFGQWESQGRAMGFRCIAAGPFVRSSYRAQDIFEDMITS